MADENAQEQAEGGGGGGGISDDAPAVDCPKCEECVPGLPGWMATFSDMVTLLLTFFVLLLSFAKTETEKFQAALGSVRNAFGGNVLKQGKVLQTGKSPDDSPSMLDSQEPIKPFPIDFLTMEGLLDKKEINRSSTETLNEMRRALRNYDLAESVDIFETNEGIKVRVKDKIFFKKGSQEIDVITIEVFDRMVNLLRQENWVVFVEGHASQGEVGPSGLDAFALSAARTGVVSRALIKRGIKSDRITAVYYGDTRPDTNYSDNRSVPKFDRRVEFLIRKNDLRTRGHKVNSQ